MFRCPLEREKELRLERVSICYLCSEEQCDVEKVINPEGMLPQDISPFFSSLALSMAYFSSLQGAALEPAFQNVLRKQSRLAVLLIFIYLRGFLCFILF